MSDYNIMIKELEEIALSPDKAVAKTIRETGKQAIGCFPIYTPEEIIYAAGLIPVGMWGGKTELKQADRFLQAFCCSIMRSNIEYSLKGTYNSLKAVIIPTFCDTLKCICENWKVALPNIPLIPMVYPQNRNIDAGYVYLIEELERVKIELEKIAGIKITDSMLEASFMIYEEYRETMREFVKLARDYPLTINARARHLIIKAGYFMDKKDYTQKIKSINADLKAEPSDILSVFAKNKIAIAADDLAQESRQWRTISRKEGSTIEKIAYRTVDQKGCTFLYEVEKTRGQMLIDMVKETQAKGVVVFMMKFCDPEEFDYPIYKEELEKAGIPLLYLEIDQQLNSFAQIETRVQSFVEMMS